MKIIKYGTPHCGMCMAMTQNLNNAMLPIPIVEKNCDDEEVNKEAVSLGIKNIPTTILLDDNDKELVRWNGIVSSKVILDAINNATKKVNHPASYIYIFDFSTGDIYERELTEEEQEIEGEEILIKHGFRPTDCGYMVTSGKKEIKILD